ncbi:MAG TPA: hypothetical protein V6D47_04555, partial [Oscillatoriaceae cyanobacterium]
MQAFKYPDSPPPRHSRRPRQSLAAWLVAGAIAAGGGLFLSPAPAAVVGSLTRLMAARSPDGAQIAQARQSEREGNRQLAQGQYEKAARSFAAALAIDPTATSAYRRAQDASYLSGHAFDLSAVLPDTERRAALEIALGDAALARGDAAEALVDDDQACHLAPQASTALEGRARALMAVGRTAEAIAAFQAAVATKPQDPALADALIAARYQAGQEVDAENAAIAAFGPLAAQDGSETVQVGLMEAYVRRGLAPQAVLATVAAPSNLAPAWRQFFLAEAYMRDYLANPNWHTAAREQMRAIAEHALKLAGPAEAHAAAQALIARATAIEAQRAYDHADFDQASRLLDQALALKSSLNDPHELAALYVRRAHLENTPRALERDLEAALALAPENPCRAELARAESAQGVLALSLGKPDQALAPFARALALQPDDAAIAVRYAQALTQAQVDDVLGHCARAIGTGDRDAAAALIARGLLAQHQTDRLAALLGRSSHARLVQAERLLAQGHQPAAREALIEEAPTHPALWKRLGGIDQAIAATSRGPARVAALQRARDDYRKALALEDDAHVRGALLGCERQLAESALARNSREAQAIAERALILAPHNPWLS